jgi:hypothetical protein
MSQPTPLQSDTASEARPRFDVKATSIVDPQLAHVHKEGARLCGGVHTCLALIEV